MLVDAYSNAPSSDQGFAARWSPDGGRILFASQRSGAPELYEGDPAAPAAATALRARGVPVEYMVAAHEGHSVDRRETKLELMVRIARFLEDALR